MAYLRPDVYVEELNTGEKPINFNGTSRGGFIGETPRGVAGVPVLVTSWSDFVRKFAGGLNSPFLATSDLSYAVYGFFQNGGSSCYITRVVGADAVVAQATLNTLVIKAKELGAWANNVMKVQVKKNLNETFVLNVTISDNSVETLDGLTAENFREVIKSTSNYITVDSGDTPLAEGSATFDKGTNGADTLSDPDYVKALKAFDIITDVNLLAIPGKTSDTVLKAILDYCDGKGNCFAILDAPKEDVATLVTSRAKIQGNNGAIYTPWGKVVDPLSTRGNLRLCPPSGHIMGAIARTDRERGVHKAPAGEAVNLRGMVDLNSFYTNADVETLNPLGINCIISRPNKGIIVWGARTLSSDPKKRYISDVRFDIMVKRDTYEGTQWAVFEPNDELLWSRLDSSLKAYLDTLWRMGALKGDSPEKAYYVKCDAELNNEDSINAGQLISEIGYAKKRPAEFVVLRIVQKSNE